MTLTAKFVLLLCSVISFTLNAFGITAKVNLDALGKALAVASLLV